MMASRCLALLVLCASNPATTQAQREPDVYEAPAPTPSIRGAIGGWTSELLKGVDCEKASQNGEGLVRLCNDLKEKSLKAATEENMAAAEGDLGRLSMNSAGKNVALGCTSLLKAMNNGKMEWFESQQWYRKALKMCTSISSRSPQELDRSFQMQQGQAVSKMETLRERSPASLLKQTCAKLTNLLPTHAVRSHMWFSKAEQMCSTISGKSPEQLRSMLQRAQMQAETASGQLLKQTCDKLKDASNNGGMANFRDEPWYPTAVAMCSKLGARQVNVEGLARRCARLEVIERSGRSDELKMKPWFSQLKKTCGWIHHRPNQIGTKRVAMPWNKMPANTGRGSQMYPNGYTTIPPSDPVFV